MEEILQLVGPSRHHILQQIMVMMVLLQIFMVVVRFMGTLLLGVQQTLKERDPVHLVMGLAMEPLIFLGIILLTMLVVIVLLRDRQIEVLLARRIRDISLF